ncbi:hydantoinase/oxoprolinase family protein [Bacillus sp. Marseille-P3661]|uniref:hydantoinase/oxoprolinase family protein n=1 Tax=Bacillus sp. Marseille-P3661 TaxID=1936234 RepID=UPI0015E1AACE|nr:hydantoinase/oxoprolinase family protein [Bacillus sp. Marseille-P3661]
MSIYLGVDIGGTFTDLIAFDQDSGELYHAKRPTTYNDLVEGIINCTQKSGVSLKKTDNVVHGTTIAINTVIEQTGARTALITTRGTRDVYRLGRGNRPEAYNLFFHRPKPLVSRELTYEVKGRMLADGSELEPLDLKEIEELCNELRNQKIESVAVCFIHAYANPEHEKIVGEIIRQQLPECYVSLSHEILREYREYERTSTTVLNSYVGPKVSNYINRLEDKIGTFGFNGNLSIMQSNGGIMSPTTAAAKPVNMMESGPVGGIIASAEVGRALGFNNVIAFDMGGTTAKASLIQESQPIMSEMYYIGGYASGQPVMIPVVDVVEVGTGGGSIAWLDEVGALKVGPQSAGSDPAPISYGKGGTEPTFTDANVVLGRIGAEDFLGGDMPLDKESAEKGLKAKIADPLDLDTLRAAHAIFQIAIANMSLAVREVSVERGNDPRDFVLVASGGAGPLSAVAIAKELHIPKVIIPRYPAHFSAIGMLLTDQKHDFVRTHYSELENVNFEDLLQIHNEMIQEAKDLIASESITTKEVEFQAFLDIRYVGQEFTLAVPVSETDIKQADIQTIRSSFDEIHDKRFGHKAPDEKVEIVNIRLTVTGKRNKPKFSEIQTGVQEPQPKYRPVYFDDMTTPVNCPVYYRDTLPAGFRFSGPALVQEYASTTVIYDQDVCEVSGTGELIISIGGI